MNDFRALRPVLVVVAILAAVMLAIYAAVALDNASLIVPPPETTAEQLISALGAHRYEGAMNQLSQELKQQVKEDDLHALVESIESSRQGIQDAHEQGAHEQGQSATASIIIKLGDGQEQTVDLPLQKENGLWKVTSIEALRSLIGG
jgi:hypothetical protein